VSSDRYDIVAKSDTDFEPGQRNQAVMALLAERFQLAVHHEAREEAGLAIATGKQAPELSPAKEGAATDIRLAGRRQLIFQAVDMSRLANYLHQILRVPVLDHTGIKGRFDFTLELDRVAGDSAAAATPRPAFPDLLRAAIERFGFRLEPEKISVDTTVIDHVERPSEN
jgi:uncharacterized protein (TIGR03435 family)